MSQKELHVDKHVNFVRVLDTVFPSSCSCSLPRCSTPTMRPSPPLFVLL